MLNSSVPELLWGSAVMGDAGGASALCRCGGVSTKQAVLGSRNLSRYKVRGNVVLEGKGPLLGTSLSRNKILSSPQYTYTQVWGFLLVCKYTKGTKYCAEKDFRYP